MGVILTPCCIQSKVQDKFQGNSRADLGELAEKIDPGRVLVIQPCCPREREHQYVHDFWAAQRRGASLHSSQAGDGGTNDTPFIRGCK